MSGQCFGWVLKNGPRKEDLDRFGNPYGTKARGMRAVLVTIADVANPDGRHAHPGLKAMEEGSLYSKRQVGEILAELLAEGWVAVEQKGGSPGRATVYAVCMDRRDEVAVGATLQSDDLNLAITEKRVRPEDLTLQSPYLEPARNVLSTGNSNGKPQLSATPTVVRVFEAWVKSTKRGGRTVLDAKRRALITKALADYPEEDVLDAVRGWEHSAHHRGETQDNRTVYNDLSLLLRDAANIERFRDLARGPREVARNHKEPTGIGRPIIEDRDSPSRRLIPGEDY